jgi:hypothetical protein
VPKKVPTRAVPAPLSAEARNFVLQGQPPADPSRPSVPPPPEPIPAAPVVIPAAPVALPAAPVVIPPAPALPSIAAPVTRTQPPPAAAPRARKRSNRTLISRVDGRTLRRLQIYLDAEVAKRLKHHCVEHDIDMSAYVNEVLAKALR